MSRIVTFYSYKGGVGRSMALANVAVLLARRGLRVLAVDWDLEAPGLERYFSALIAKSGEGGLLNLLCDFATYEYDKKLLLADAQRLSNFCRRYVSTIGEPNSGTEFSLLPSGRATDGAYDTKLEKFNWHSFFADHDGGAFLEELRNCWQKEFDVVLIDSRTGLTDAGGVCTIQLPDIVVPMFTANHQSLYGACDVMKLAQHARQKLAYDRMPLTIFPLPARFGVSTEFAESQEWLDRFEEALAQFYRDWLPAKVSPRAVLERVKVPQVDYFSFGEKLAVIDQGIADPQSMGYVYDRVADLLARDFSDVESWLGPVATETPTSPTFLTTNVGSASSSRVDNDEFDIYVSYAHRSVSYEWLRGFLRLLTMYLQRNLGRPIRVFADQSEIALGAHWETQIADALRRSNVFLALVSRAYGANSSCRRELALFARSAGSGTSRIVPVRVDDAPLTNFPVELVDVQMVDFYTYIRSGRTFERSAKYLEFQLEVQKLADRVSKQLRR